MQLFTHFPSKLDLLIANLSILPCHSKLSLMMQLPLSQLQFQKVNIGSASVVLDVGEARSKIKSSQYRLILRKSLWNR